MDYARMTTEAKIEHVRVQLGTLGWALGGMGYVWCGRRR